MLCDFKEALMTATKTTRGRRSKAEVQQTLENIIQENTDSQLLKSSKAEAIEKLKEEEIHASVDHLNMETIASHVSSLNTEISKTLAEISVKMTSEMQLLMQLRAAVALERKELEKLHKIDVAATALDQLLTDYIAKKSEWEKEEQQRTLAAKEYEELLKKARQREVEEYEYKKVIERKKAHDQFEEALHLREKENTQKAAELQHQWQARESALVEKERAYAEAIKSCESFPDRLQKEVLTSVSAAVKATEEKLQQEAALLKKDYDAEKRLAEVKIQTLEEHIARQSAQIELLQKQAELAKKQVEEIAVKAIEGASEKRALEHVNLIAREQAKSRSTNS